MAAARLVKSAAELGAALDAAPVEIGFGGGAGVRGQERDGHPRIEAFRQRGAPLKVLHLDEKRVRDVYGASVFLLRPDLHIVWRGDGPPDDPAGLAALATGWGPPRAVHQPRIKLAG